MFLDVLTTAAKPLFRSLEQFKTDFYLAGGTGLALQIGHRVSIDFDLFSDEPIKRHLLKRVEELYRGQPLDVVVANRNELSMLIAGVKFTFLHHPFPPVLPLNADGPIGTLCIKEILAAKAYTIGRRGEFKDYIDIYSGLKGKYITLSELIEIARQKYADAFNDRLFLEQLVYLDDVEEAELAMFPKGTPRKAELLEFFSNAIESEVLP